MSHWVCEMRQWRVFRDHIERFCAPSDSKSQQGKRSRHRGTKTPDQHKGNWKETEGMESHERDARSGN